MNDQDYIKAGVELAGWQTTRLGNQRVAVFIPSDECNKGMLLRIGYLDQPHIQAALAAQLKRQVNAIHHYEVITMIETSCVRDWQHSPKHHDIATVTGYDFTMNDIKVVVDSKVLTSR